MTLDEIEVEENLLLAPVIARLVTCRASDLQGPFPMPGRVTHVAFRLSTLNVMVGVEVHGPGVGTWLHVSYSLRGVDKPPEHKHTCRIRSLFFEPTQVVIAVFPPVAEYVNDAEVLHLWSRLDPAERLVPDLRSQDDEGTRRI